MSDKTNEHTLDGDLKRLGNGWVLGSISGRRQLNGREDTLYAGGHENWPS
jgi:hypothetical protein